MSFAIRPTARMTEKPSTHNAAPSFAQASRSGKPHSGTAGMPRFLRFDPDSAVGSPAATAPRYLQAKPAVSQPGDACEQEADQVAQQVMRMPEPEMHDHHAGQGVQIHRKASASAAASHKPSSPSNGRPMRHSAGSLSGAGQALPHAAQQFFAARMGADFSDVRIHHDTQAAQLSTDLQARAFTYGSHIAFASGEYSTDSSAGRQLLAHELTHVLQQRGQSGHMVQRDLALTSLSKGVGSGPTLTSQQQAAAIIYNKLRFKGIPDMVLRMTEDIVGTPREAITIDEVFVTAIANWQSWWKLPEDGRMTPMTAHAFASELRAEASNMRNWKSNATDIKEMDEAARYFDQMGAAPFREGAASAASAGNWAPPSGVDKLRAELSQDLQQDAAGAAKTWRDRAYVIRSGTLGEDDRGEYLAVIAGGLSGKGAMAQAMEVVSLIDVVSEGAREQMGKALNSVAVNATENETTARDYLKMLLRMTGVASKDTPADPQAWLQNNTEAVGQAIRVMEPVLGGEIARQLTNSVLKASFTTDYKFSVTPSGAGNIANLPKDANAGKRLLADCDVYAVYGMRLLRAQGWETVGYFSFQGKTKDDLAHAIGLARRKTTDGNTEYVSIDSMKSPMVVFLGTMASDDAAKAEADKRVSGWGNHFFAPPVGAGAIDPRLNTLHPEALRYPPAAP